MTKFIACTCRHHRHRKKMLTSIDLFSGLGGITLATHPFVKPLMYCEKDTIARSVLEANMEAGTLPRAPVHEDVCTLSTYEDIPTDVDMLVAGVPCVGFSSLGLREGFENSQSNLFFDMLKVADKCRCGSLFLENVPGIMNFKETLIHELVTKRGFELRWMVQSASELGAVHHRKRWYCLAYKPSFVRERLSTFQLVDDKKAFDWSNDRPPPRTIMCEDKMHQRRIDAGWALLGNSVVPDAVRTAFFRLFTLGACAHLKGDGKKYDFASEPHVDFVNGKTYEVTLWSKDKGSTVLQLFGKRDTIPRQIVLDPSLVPPPPKTSPNQTTPCLTEPYDCKFLSTPRHGMVRPCRVLTSRSSRDLPTQILFEKNTRNRNWPASPMFGQWMMGYPSNYIVMPVSSV